MMSDMLQVYDMLQLVVVMRGRPFRTVSDKLKSHLQNSEFRG